jgi:hypothetical protein
MASKDKKPLAPEEVQKIKEAAAAAKEDILSASFLDAVLNVDPNNLITAEPDPDLKKGNAKGSAGWMHGPGNFEMFSIAVRRLVKVSNDQGIQGNRVERVQVFVIPNTKIMVIKGAPANDHTAVEVTRYKGSNSLWINCFNALAKAGLTVDSGWKELYNVVYLPKASPLYPGLGINLDDRRDRQAEPIPKKKSKKKKPEPDGQQNNPTPDGSADQPATDPVPDQSPETSQQPAE